jgi:signal transduction histidine kinase
VFCFNSRNNAQLSRLPYFSKDLPVRISLECKDQVLRTCQSVVDRLHHFWLRVDEEQSHRSLGHTLRSSLTVMTRYQGRLRDQLRIHKNDMPDRLQGFYSVAQNAHECVRIGSKVIDHELDKLTLASTLEEVIVAGSEGEADVASILRNLEPQFKLSGEADGKRWYWLSCLPNQAIVRGSEELINLAVRNVIDNAYKYSLAPRDVRIDLRKGKKHWRLTVHNDGVAIRADEIPRITLKGYRGIYARKRQDVAAEGTGLGMYLVKRVMDAIHGRVCVKCECHTRGGEALETGVVSVALVFPALNKE